MIRELTIWSEKKWDEVDISLRAECLYEGSGRAISSIADDLHLREILRREKCINVRDPVR